jgi:hypothetical protein
MCKRSVPPSWPLSGSIAVLLVGYSLAETTRREIAPGRDTPPGDRARENSRDEEKVETWHGRRETLREAEESG